MNKKYALPNKQVADLLIAALAPANDSEGNPTNVMGIKGTDTTHAIVRLGHQPRYDADGEPIGNGTTYDIDISWKDGEDASNALGNFESYSIVPLVSTHKFL